MCWSVLALRSLAVFTGALLTAEGLYYLLRYVRKFREQKPKVLFFPTPVTCLRPLLLSPRHCDCSLPHGESALSSLARLLLGAGRSLDVCVFTISSSDLGSLVLAVYGRGVRVRVITDSDYMALAGSQVGIFRKAGIEVRHDQDTNYMHHKFALIDGSILVTGSLNWSAQAIFRNKENVIIIEDFDIVKAFIEEFERLWNEYDPTKYSFSPQRCCLTCMCCSRFPVSAESRVYNRCKDVSLCCHIKNQRNTFKIKTRLLRTK
ncbi:mitochondrial cardiolipin hydrolase isoform X2 [Hypanus sabinus]|uniref:mitochondrial cardiolipin hydrolase isoform X2 n=1 Tax=Hypanus sabinus TaxID=79690 RepID=UPI0028C4867C|nr:mitochondrial cardiolipin hydrolase isoform X2 [Hypanus sabinus]